nr:type II secretion system protein [Pyrinomonadaceae bacterium]
MSKSRLLKRNAGAPQRFFGAHLRLRRRQTGFTLIELVITLTILSILTLGVIPLVKTSFKRQREQRLRQALSEMRAAIDEFHRDVIGGQCALPTQN